MKLTHLIVFLGLSLAAIIPAHAAARRIGCWWWFSADAYNETVCAQYLDELQKACVTEVYFYAYTDVVSGNWERVHTFVQKAMSRGMRVAILFDDWADFLDYDGLYFTTKLVPQFLAYRKQYPNDDVYGLHFDIEPGGYNTKVLQNYCDFFIAKVQAAREQGVHCEVDVACGWNDQGGKTVAFRGTTGIYNIIAQYTDTMAFMSYRDVAQRMIEFSNLAALPAAVANGCDFLIGVETADSGEGDAVDFHEEDKPYLFQEMDKAFQLLDAMDLTVGYGMAIHQARSFVSLPGSVPEGNGRNTWGKPVSPLCTQMYQDALSVGEMVPGVQYTVFGATELQGPYTAVKDSFTYKASDPEEMEFELPNLGEKGFFRITAGVESVLKGARLVLQ